MVHKLKPDVKYAFSMFSMILDKHFLKPSLRYTKWHALNIFCVQAIYFKLLLALNQEHANFI